MKEDVVVTSRGFAIEESGGDVLVGTDGRLGTNFKAAAYIPIFNGIIKS